MWQQSIFLLMQSHQFDFSYWVTLVHIIHIVKIPLRKYEYVSPDPCSWTNPSPTPAFQALQAGPASLVPTPYLPHSLGLYPPGVPHGFWPPASLPYGVLTSPNYHVVGVLLGGHMCPPRLGVPWPSCLVDLPFLSAGTGGQGHCSPSPSAQTAPDGKELSCLHWGALF